MKLLRIAPDLSLPADTVTQTIAILAKRRAGKSYTARRFAEQFFASGQQVIIVDPKGDWWGMRSGADAKTPGLPITILGGEHGDAPLEAGAGEIVAKLAVEECVRLLLDLSLFRKHEISTFMTAFLETLYRLKAQERYRTPVMLIVDEADAIAPQKPFKGEERMLGAAEDIVRRGGQRGIGCILVTQRSAVLNKNVLTQSEMLVALRTISPQDIEAMHAWIEKHGTPEQGKVLIDSLPSLPIGDAWFWSPGWPTEAGIFQRVHVLPIETFDSGATPKSGEKRIEPKRLAPVDLDRLKERMAATIERAKADDPRALRARIAELERAAKKPPVKVDPAPGKAASKDALEKATLRGAVQMANQVAREFTHVVCPVRRVMLRAVTTLRAIAEEMEAVMPPESLKVKATVDLPAEVDPPAAAVPRPPVSNRIKPDRNISREASSNGNISGTEQRILNALAELEALGVENAPRVQVAFMAGYTNLASKGFANAIGALRTARHIDYPGAGAIALTGSGRARGRTPEAPRTSEELQDRLIAMLGGANGRIVRALVEAYPDSLLRDELAAMAGYTNVASKGFANAIGRLRTLGFIDYPSPGQVAAQKVLFLEGT